MADDDKRVSEIYRRLAREEPPAALDAQIVGAARRAVVPRLRAWYVPVSLAAVVVLSVAVTLRIQHEQPDLETVAALPPAKDAAPAKAAAPAAEAQPVAPPPVPDKPVTRPKQAPAERVSPAFVPDPEARSRAAPAPAARDDRAAAEPSLQAAPALPAAVPAPRAAAPAAPAAQASQAAGAAEPPAAAPRRAVGAVEATRDALTRERQERPAAVAPQQELAKQSAANEPPERWLERIVALRREGRQAEADASYAEFRKRYPDYRIAQEMLEKVQPR